MLTAGQKHALKTEVNRLNSSLTTKLKKYGHSGDIIPIQAYQPIYRNDYFKELLVQRQMLWKVLGILDLHFEEGFKLLPRPL